MKSVFIFVAQSIVVGLAVAFLVVLARPDLLPSFEAPGGAPAMSFADAVAISAPAVANIYTRRLVAEPVAGDENGRLRVDSSYGSAVIIDPDGYLVTNFHVVA